MPLPGRQLRRNACGSCESATCTLYLLDTDLPENETDIATSPTGSTEAIAHRLEQEIVLGIGGARALEALGLQPTVWHINEGHAAFLILERIRAHAPGLEFDARSRAVAANTLFTTHTGCPRDTTTSPTTCSPRTSVSSARPGVPASRCSRSGRCTAPATST